MSRNNPPKPRKKDWQGDESGPLNRRRKRPRQRDYGIEVYLQAWSIIHRLAGWYIHDWYTLESQRDMALDNLNKKVRAVGIQPRTQYRKIDRGEAIKT